MLLNPYSYVDLKGHRSYRKLPLIRTVKCGYWGNSFFIQIQIFWDPVYDGDQQWFGTYQVHFTSLGFKNFCEAN